MRRRLGLAVPTYSYGRLVGRWLRTRAWRRAARPKRWSPTGACSWTASSCPTSAPRCETLSLLRAAGGRQLAVGSRLPHVN